MKRYQLFLIFIFTSALLYFGFVSTSPLKLVNTYSIAQAQGSTETRVTPDDLKRLRDEIRNLEREVRDLKSQVRSLESKVRQLDLNSP